MIVPLKTIRKRFVAGIEGFRAEFGEFATDGKLVRAGAMSPFDISLIVSGLERGGWEEKGLGSRG